MYKRAYILTEIRINNLYYIILPYNLVNSR